MTTPRHPGYLRRRTLDRMADDMRRQQQRAMRQAHARLLDQMREQVEARIKALPHLVNPADLADPADLFDSAADADGQLHLPGTCLH